MTLPLLLLIELLCAYRLTRLVTTDTFPPVEKLRDRIVTANTMTRQTTTGTIIDPGPWAELVQCPWCSSVYIAFGIAAGHWCAFGLPSPGFVFPALALALSAAVGMLSQVVDE